MIALPRRLHRAEPPQDIRRVVFGNIPPRERRLGGVGAVANYRQGRNAFIFCDAIAAMVCFGLRTIMSYAFSEMLRTRGLVASFATSIQSRSVAVT